MLSNKYACRHVEMKEKIIIYYGIKMIEVKFLSNVKADIKKKSIELMADEKRNFHSPLLFCVQGQIFRIRTFHYHTWKIVVVLRWDREGRERQQKKNKTKQNMVDKKKFITVQVSLIFSRLFHSSLKKFMFRTYQKRHLQPKNHSFLGSQLSCNRDHF